MEAEDYGFSIEAENDDVETCYGSPVRAISSVGRAPARQDNFHGCGALVEVAANGRNAASLSAESADASSSPETLTRRVSGAPVAISLPREAA